MRMDLEQLILMVRKYQYFQKIKRNQFNILSSRIYEHDDGLDHAKDSIEEIFDHAAHETLIITVWTKMSIFWT